MNSDGPTAGTRRSPDSGEGPEVLERAIAALPPPPPPPSMDHVWAAIEKAPAHRGLWVRAAIAASILVAAGAGALSRRSGDGNPATGTASIRVMDPAAVRVLRGDVEVDPQSISLGDRVEARRATTLSLGARVRADLDADSSLLLVDSMELRQISGRIRYDVVHHRVGDPVVIHTPSFVLNDIGTEFTVDVTAADESAKRAARTLLTVESGSVLVAWYPTVDYAVFKPSPTTLTVGAGYGVTFSGGAPSGPMWPLDAKPALSLELATPAPEANAPAEFRVTLTNPTDGWIALPARDAARTPLWIEVRGADGAVRPIRVTEDRVVADATGVGSETGRAIPPRGRVSIRVRFESAFASPGTYRLRAVYRAPDAVESPASPEVTVTVR